MPGKIVLESPDKVLGRNLTRCHDATVRDLLEKIDATDGFFHTSTRDAPCYDVHGRLVGHGIHYNTCWTRDAGRGITELAHLGHEIVRKSCDWLGRHLMYAPPRWVRAYARDGEDFYPTRGAWSDGHLETDGHAAVLVGMADTLRYFGAGDDVTRKVLLDQYATGLKWLFHHSERSQFHHLLFTDSEVSERNYGSYDIYSNTFACQALRYAARLLPVLFEKCPALPVELAGRLSEDIGVYLRDPDRDMWLQGRFSDGRVQQHMSHAMGETLEFQHVLFQLAPLLLFTEGGSYDPLTDQEPAWVRTSERTFDDILSISRRRFRQEGLGSFYAGNCYGIVPPVEFGGVSQATSMQFGHGLFTQAALLLDRMAVFEEALATIARGVDNPLFGDTYRYVAPHLCFREGEVHGYGDIGNLVNSAELLKIVRLMAGVDDSGQTLRIMPRVPAGWQIQAVDVPVALVREDGIVRGRVSLTVEHEVHGASLSVTVAGDIDTFSVRMGPFPGTEGRHGLTVVDGPEPAWRESGDSLWAAFEGLADRRVDLRLGLRP